MATGNPYNNDQRVTLEQTFGLRSSQADDPALRSLADAASQQNINPAELGASLPNIGVSFAPNLPNWMPSTVRPVVSSSIPPEIRSAILRNQHLLPEVSFYLPAPNEQLQGYPRTGDINEYQFFPQQRGLNVNEISGHYFEPAPVSAAFQMLHRESRFAPGGNSFVMPPLDNPVAGARRSGISLDLSLGNSNSQLGLNYELFNHQLNEGSNNMLAEFAGYYPGNNIPTSSNWRARPPVSGFRGLEAHAARGPDMITGTVSQPQSKKGGTSKEDAILLQSSINETAKGQIGSSFKEIEISRGNKRTSNESVNDYYRVPDLNLVPVDMEYPEATEERREALGSMKTPPE